MASVAEVWLPVVGFEFKYEVSDCGNVRHVGGKAVKAYRYEGKYPSVMLRPGPGVAVRREVHVLVMRAFVGERPEGMQICHADGDKNNSSLKNLRYDTPKANNADKYKHGTDGNGERHWNARLTKEQAIEIVTLSKSGVKQAELYRRFGVARGTISQIVRGRRWGYITGAKLQAPGHVKGSRHGLAKLTESAVREIMAGGTVGELATRFKVDRETIQQVLRGHSWRHVTGLDCCSCPSCNKRRARQRVRETASVNDTSRHTSPPLKR